MRRVEGPLPSHAPALCARDRSAHPEIVEDSIRLGRIAGVQVGLNWSVLVVAWILVLGLATEALPALAPDQPTAAYWLAAAVAAVAFFASLLAHELAHALVARHLGTEVRSITLWLLGGVAKMSCDARSAGAEWRIGVAGPLMSLGIAAGAGLLAFSLDLLGAPALVGGVLGWLALINAMLGLFNLLPAFPLDGGRVLRALLWHHGGDRLRATVVAAGVGRTFGYVLIGFGVLLFTGGVLFSGLWFGLLGWFLVSAANAEAATVQRHDLLAGLVVRDLMSRDPVVAPAGITAAELLEHYVFRYRHSSYPIVEPDGTPVGLVTLDRIRRVPPEDRNLARLREIAHPLAEVPCTGPDATVESVVPPLAASRAGRALVLDADGHLVGILALSDVARALDLRALWRGAYPSSRSTAVASKA